MVLVRDLGSNLPASTEFWFVRVRGGGTASMPLTFITADNVVGSMSVQVAVCGSVARRCVEPPL
jgi:hypothetical protein